MRLQNAKGRRTLVPVLNHMAAQPTTAAVHSISSPGSFFIFYSNVWVHSFARDVQILVEPVVLRFYPSKPLTAKTILPESSSITTWKKKPGGGNAVPLAPVA